MDDLTAFLKARLDEREHFAKIARLAQKHREQMLREVEADRAIVSRCAEAIRDQGIWGEDGQAALAEDVLRHLAAVDSGRPDYRPEWKP